MTTPWSIFNPTPICRRVSLPPLVENQFIGFWGSGEDVGLICDGQKYTLMTVRKIKQLRGGIIVGQGFVWEELRTSIMFRAISGPEGRHVTAYTTQGPKGKKTYDGGRQRWEERGGWSLTLTFDRRQQQFNLQVFIQPPTIFQFARWRQHICILPPGVDKITCRGFLFELENMNRFSATSASPCCVWRLTSFLPALNWLDTGMILQDKFHFKKKHPNICS